MWLIIFVSELERKELPAGYEGFKQMLKSSPTGSNKYECLRLKKTDVTLWLNLKVVQFASERVESLPAAKRRKLDERSESEVVVGAKALEFLLKFMYSGRLESVAGLDCDAVAELINAGTKVKYLIK
jgi:hypothetical protein